MLERVFSERFIGDSASGLLDRRQFIKALEYFRIFFGD